MEKRRHGFGEALPKSDFEPASGLWKGIIAPSGRKLEKSDCELLLQGHNRGFIRYSEEPFQLKSGILSHVYVFGREDMTDHPFFEWTVGKKIEEILLAATTHCNQQPCLIGIPTAGTTMAQAAVMASFCPGIGRDGWICHRVMRETLKTHGVHHSWVNGAPSKRHEYWLVDNVATNGASKLEAHAKLVESGYCTETQFPPVLIFVDRQQGAVENLRKAGFDRIEVVYNLLDIAFAMREMQLWPAGVVDKVQTEIAAHQTTK